MELRSLLLLLCVSEVFQQGGTALIETQQFVTVEIGGDAQLSCFPSETKDVVQVDFWKCSPQGEERLLASSKKKFDERVNPDLRGKAAFTNAGLQSSAIVVRNVTDQDEGSYQCAVYTSSRYFKKEVYLRVNGRPSPAVTPSVLPQDLQLSHNNTNMTTGLSGSEVTVIVVVVLIVLVCVCAAVLLIMKRNRGNRNSEKFGPPKSTPPTQGNQVSLLQHENEGLSQQESSAEMDEAAV